MLHDKRLLMFVAALALDILVAEYPSSSALAADETLLATIPELDRQALNGRFAITSCELEIAKRTEQKQDQDSTVVQNKMVFLISGRKILFKRSYSTSAAADAWCRNCEADGYVLKFRSDDQGVNVAARFRRLASLPNDSLENLIPDPRLIGLVIDWASTFPELPIDNFIGRKDRKDLKAVRERLEDQDCVHVSYRYRADVTVSYWIAPALGHSVLRFDFSTDRGDVIQTTVRPKRCEPSGIWFPEWFESKTTRNGRLERRETGTVIIKSMNQAIDQQRFTIPALGLRPGTPLLSIPPSGESKRWTGSELVDLEDDDGRLAPTASSSSRSNKWLIRGMIVLGAAALVVGLQLLRRRSRARGQAR